MPFDSPDPLCVPTFELASRARTLAALLRAASLDGAFLLHPSSAFYLTGTLADGYAFLDADGRVGLAVRRSSSRAALDTAIPLAPIRRPDELPAALASLGLTPGARLGLEMDVVPAAVLDRLRRIFPAASFADVAPIVREVRAVKTSYEISWIERAAEQLRVVMDERVASTLREGMPEIEVMAFLEHELRLLRHQGTIRMRRWTMEMHYGTVSCGVSALHPCSFDGPDGLEALYPAVQQGGGERRLTRRTPILVDFVGASGGYLADRTRVFSIGEPPAIAREANDVCRSVLRRIEAGLRAGAIPSALHAAAAEVVASSPWSDSFMGWRENRVGFVGHGIGLDLDELPILAPRFDAPLVAGNILAIEPKIFLEGIGGVGVENTYVVTEDGCRNLTPGPEEIRVV